MRIGDLRLKLHPGRGRFVYEIDVDGSTAGMKARCAWIVWHDGARVDYGWSYVHSAHRGGSERAELRGLECAMSNLPDLIRGHPTRVWTDATSTFSRLEKATRKPRKRRKRSIDKISARIRAMARDHGARLELWWCPRHHLYEADALASWRGRPMTPQTFAYSDPETRIALT